MRRRRPKAKHLCRREAPLGSKQVGAVKTDAVAPTSTHAYKHISVRVLFLVWNRTEAPGMNICPGSANPPRQPVCSNGPVKYAVDRAHFTRANNSRRSAAPHSAAQVRDDPGGSSFPSPRCGTSLTKSHLTRTQKPRNVVLWNLWSREVEYEEAWRFQKFEANEYAIDPDNQADRLLLLQHPPVYTLGICPISPVGPVTNRE